MLHSCGDIRLLLPDLIEAGLDAVNPVQISCKGMDAAGLKRDFGKDITFWGGGCDTQWLLSHGTPEAVSRARHSSRSRSCGRAAALSSSRCTTSWRTCPAENIVAMLDTARGLVNVSMKPVMDGMTGDDPVCESGS